MFPIRKRKTTYGTFAPEAKRTKYETIDIMPYMRRTYKRRSTFKRRTPYNKRSNNGGFFNPKGSQPPVKRKLWDWLKVRVAITQTTNQNITATDIISEAVNQLDYQPSAIKISSVQFWNSAGVAAGQQKPYIIIEPYSQHSVATAPDTLIGKTEDEGNLQTPAKIGYKWSATDAQTVYPFGSTRNIIRVSAENGENCYAHFMIQHFKS